MHYDRILVPTDLSRFGELAAREGLEHLEPKGILRLIHVVQPQYVVVGTLSAAAPVYDPAQTKKRMAQAGLQLQRLAKKLGPRVEARVLAGASPASVSAAEARRFKARLLVLATHGRGSLGQIFFGSVAQKLLQLYRGPVILLRPARSRTSRGL